MLAAVPGFAWANPDLKSPQNGAILKSESWSTLKWNASVPGTYYEGDNEIFTQLEGTFAEISTSPEIKADGYFSKPKINSADKSYYTVYSEDYWSFKRAKPFKNSVNAYEKLVLPAGTYYWHVQATVSRFSSPSGSGVDSSTKTTIKDWSPVWSFVVPRYKTRTFVDAFHNKDNLGTTLAFGARDTKGTFDINFAKYKVQQFIRGRYRTIKTLKGYGNGNYGNLFKYKGPNNYRIYFVGDKNFLPSYSRKFRVNFKKFGWFAETIK